MQEKLTTQEEQKKKTNHNMQTSANNVNNTI